MIDLHCHILPDVDDGAADLEQALAMCRLAAEDGATAMVATPHVRHERFWNGDRARLEIALEELRDALGPEPELHFGAEIAVNSESRAEIERLPGGELPTLAGSRYALLEFSFHGLGPDPLDLVHELTVKGLAPIVAHPERIAWLAADPDLQTALVEHGARLQVTAMSITGELGRRPREAARRMLDAGLVSFVSSDAHDPRIRPPGLRRAYREVARGWGEDTARRLFVDHPRAVVADDPLQSVPSEAPPDATTLSPTDVQNDTPRHRWLSFLTRSR